MKEIIDQRKVIINANKRVKCNFVINMTSIENGSSLIFVMTNEDQQKHYLLELSFKEMKPNHVLNDARNYTERPHVCLSMYITTLV